MITRVAILLLICLAFQLPAAADTDAITKHSATLRRDPSTHHAPIDILSPREDVQVTDDTQTAGYYHVRTAEGEEGWVWGRSLEIVPPHSNAPAEALLATPAPGAQPARRAGPPAGVTSHIPTNWDKPDPAPTEFHGSDGDCGPTGDGGDALTNLRKNRTDEPVQYHSVNWKSVQQLPYPVAKNSLEDWTPEQLAQIKPFEGIGVSVVGYLVAIKVENRGTGESTNCHFTNVTEVDWHMPLVESAGDAEATAIVVETTPRLREVHSKWTPNTLAPWVNSGEPVRISGWVLLDPEHRAHLGKYRSTLWEIHPITKIEVFQDGQWVNADDLP